ncbi:MAG: 23S rRNA (pseudouridine(1915)-N(3))-methyltransferase RlmH, partial [Bacilli bacterium]
MITIICVGNIKENYLREAIKDYEKRIKKFHKIKIIEIPDYPNTNKEIILTKEKDKIISNLKPKDYIITLEIEGNQTTSLELSKKINNLFNYHSNIVFIIGGSHGLHQEIKKKSNY